MLVTMCAFLDKKQPVINVIHACMQNGKYRFTEPEKTFSKILKILRENPVAASWLTDKGKSNVEDYPVYKDFVDALEEGIRNVALSKSRIFKKNSIKTRASWRGVDKWRKVAVTLYILRYVNRVSSWFMTCVLMI